MITIKLKKHTDAIRSIEMRGHADFSEYGSDIVCSAVSALAITLLNSVERLANVVPLYEMNQVEGGYLFMSFDQNMTEEQQFKTQLLIESFIIGVEDIQAEYGQYVKIEHR